MPEFYLKQLEFKDDLSGLLIESLKDFREIKSNLNKTEIENVLNNGAKKTLVKAKRKITEIKKKVGLI